MTAPLYTRDILRLAATVPHLARFDELEGAAEQRSPTCGSRMRVAVALDGERRVIALKQAVEACAFGQAAAALMGQHAIGRNAEDVRAAVSAVEAWLASETSDEPWPGLSALAPARSRKGRHGAILLPFRALLAAIEEAGR